MLALSAECDIILVVTLNVRTDVFIDTLIQTNLVITKLGNSSFLSLM